jgi:hypothetical protein
LQNLSDCGQSVRDRVVAVIQCVINLGSTSRQLLTVLMASGLSLQRLVLSGCEPRIIDLGELKAEEVSARFYLSSPILTFVEGLLEPLKGFVALSDRGRQFLRAAPPYASRMVR